ncbi:hypothetical protein ABT095_08050 [Kitasatospora sp. NPDC002227]|uniref:hypothetical protein n=1 Tax=Kitasatospora sp. NPDC002227 TaxID=3154773 RepID=UPI00332B0DD6
MFGDSCLPGENNSEPTQAQLWDLHSRAEALARDTAALRARSGFLPDAVDHALTEAANRINQAAEGLADARATQWAGSCTAWWHLCPHCGRPQQTEDGRSRCLACDTTSNRPRTQCGRPGAYVAMDPTGGTVLVCAPHGHYIQARLDGSLLLPVPTP